MVFHDAASLQGQPFKDESDVEYLFNNHFTIIMLITTSMTFNFSIQSCYSRKAHAWPRRYRAVYMCQGMLYVLSCVLHLFYMRRTQGLSLDPSCPSLWWITSVFDRQKNDHFGPFYTILAHFGQTLFQKWRATLKILVKPWWDITCEVYILLFFSRQCLMF